MLAAVSGCEGSRRSFHFFLWSVGRGADPPLLHLPLPFGVGAGCPPLFPYARPAGEGTVARCSPPAAPSFLAVGGGKGARCLPPLPSPRLCWERDQRPPLLTFPRTWRNRGPAPAPLPRPSARPVLQAARRSRNIRRGPLPTPTGVRSSGHLGLTSCRRPPAELSWGVLVLAGLEVPAAWASP